MLDPARRGPRRRVDGGRRERGDVEDQGARGRHGDRPLGDRGLALDPLPRPDRGLARGRAGDPPGPRRREAGRDRLHDQERGDLLHDDAHRLFAGRRQGRPRRPADRRDLLRRQPRAARRRRSDRNPDDYKRVRVHLDWATRAHRAQRHADLLDHQPGRWSRPVGHRTDDDLAGVQLTDEVRIESSSASPVNSASFLATTSGFAADLNWSVNGDSQGKANGGPDELDVHLELHGPRDGPEQHRLLRLQVLHPGRRLRRRGPRGHPASPDGHPEPARADRGGRRRRPAETAPATAWTSTGPQPGVRRDRLPGVPQHDVRRRSAPRSAVRIRARRARRSRQGVVRGRDRARDRRRSTTPSWRVDTLASGALREGTRERAEVVPASGGNSPADGAHRTSPSCIGGQPACNGPNGQPAPSGQIVVRWDPSTDSDGTIAFYRDLP